jgi:hypothetical protein
MCFDYVVLLCVGFANLGNRCLYSSRSTGFSKSSQVKLLITNNFALCKEKHHSQKQEFKASQVKLLITNNAFCIVQRATAQSKTEIFRGYGVAEAPPGF